MSDLEKISNSLINIKKKFPNIDFSYKVLDIWLEIVGQQFSKNTSAEKFVKGILYVSVKSNVWLNQIIFFKNEIINKYNLYFKDEVVKDIKFFLNRNSNNNNDDEQIFKKYSNTQDNALKLKELSEEDKIYINKCLSIIEDKDLKKKLENFFSIVRRKEITLISNGWKKCKKCRNIFNEKNYEFCRSCR